MTKDIFVTFKAGTVFFFYTGSNLRQHTFYYKTFFSLRLIVWSAKFRTSSGELQTHVYVYISGYSFFLANDH